MLKFGVIGTSKKQNERRVPIHPDHFKRISEPLRRLLIFEQGYGTPFNISDAEIAAQTSGTTMPREQLLSEIGNVIVAKPVLSDLENLREGGVLWGWPHCTQQSTN